MTNTASPAPAKSRVDLIDDCIGVIEASVDRYAAALAANPTDYVLWFDRPGLGIKVLPDGLFQVCDAASATPCDKNHVAPAYRNGCGEYAWARLRRECLQANIDSALDSIEFLKKTRVEAVAEVAAFKSGERVCFMNPRAGEDAHLKARNCGTLVEILPSDTWVDVATVDWDSGERTTVRLRDLVRPAV